MEGLNSVANLKNNYHLYFKGTKSMPKKEEPKQYTDVLTALALTAGAATGGIIGGKVVYKKYFDKLACGVKRGEINEALYNFIKNNDPKGSLFNNKKALIELNNGLTDEKLIIIKQLAKMKENNALRDYSTQKHRFSLNDIKMLLEGTNEENIKYLQQLAEKSENLGGDRIKTFSPQQILNVIQCINSENQKVAHQLIDITKIHSTEITELSQCLKNINKDNIDIWRILLSTRKKGNKTELSLEELSKLTKKIEETQNPKCAEVLLNADKKNGSGLYIHNVEEILEILPELKEKHADIYRKFYELKSTSEIKSKQSLKLLLKSNEQNIEIINSLLIKKDKNERSVIFDNYEKIEEILKLINKDNKEITKKLIELTSVKYIYTSKYNSYYTSDLLIEILQKLSSEAEREKAKTILKDKNIEDFSQFVDAFFKK